MTEDEVSDFLDQTKTIILCSTGKDGVPHPMPMWFALEEDGAVVMTTFTKSQKILNLKRDPRVSLLAESGETYSELRGVVLYGNAEIDTELESVFGTLKMVSVRMGTVRAEDTEAVREGLLASARKRCRIRVAPEKVVSWDHRKLGGVY
jgi:nitroimidazol reductase NimA-like FMN-containing flavoprotein (pyridoxamine 5'-phosphate oxidase superfamily)